VLSSVGSHILQVRFDYIGTFSLVDTRGRIQHSNFSHHADCRSNSNRIPPRLSCQLPLYPNPTLLTHSQRSHPPNILVTSQRWGLPAGPPPACPRGSSSLSMPRWVCLGSIPSSWAHSSRACYYSHSLSSSSATLPHSALVCTNHV
jgi:hypothetical protein